LLQFFGVNNTGLNAFTWNPPPAGYTALVSTSLFTCARYRNATTTDGAVQMTNNMQTVSSVSHVGYRGAQLEYRAH
jgi:hypothetical protein